MHLPWKQLIALLFALAAGVVAIEPPPINEGDVGRAGDWYAHQPRVGRLVGQSRVNSIRTTAWKTSAEGLLGVAQLSHRAASHTLLLEATRETMRGAPQATYAVCKIAMFAGRCECRLGPKPGNQLANAILKPKQLLQRFVGTNRFCTAPATRFAWQNRWWIAQSIRVGHSVF